MGYFILYIIFFPLMFLVSFFRKCKKKNLVIQTAKIGDYANTTPMFEVLEKTDILMDHVNLPFANHDERIEQRYVVNAYKKRIGQKIRLAFLLFFNNYHTVYVLIPNSLNLFLAKMCFSKETITLSTYADKWYLRVLNFNMKKVKHSVEDLTIDSYLKMIGEGLDRNQYWKILQKPLVIPQNMPLKSDKFKVGVSLSAGNKIKTIDSKTWKKVFSILNEIECEIYIFGLENEKVYLENLSQNVHAKNPIISMLGQIPLQELPYCMSVLNLYISSDTGNSYIADSVNVPTINFAGPCFWREQRPIYEKSLIVQSNAVCAPYSSVFRASYKEKCPDLYTITHSQEEAIANFIKALYKDFLQSQHSA